MSSLLAKLGRDPQHSMTLFLQGLGLFVIGLALIALGYYQQYWWQVPGLVLMAAGIALAAWGYVGIFANRLLAIFNRR